LVINLIAQGISEESRAIENLYVFRIVRVKSTD
jgi:hypothetical protein